MNSSDQRVIFRTEEKPLTSFQDSSNQRLFIKTVDKGYQGVKVSDILYVTSAANYLLIHTCQLSIKVRFTLNDFHQDICPSLLRLNRSLLVNVNHVRAIHNKQIVFINSQSVSLSLTITRKLIKQISGKDTVRRHKIGQNINK